MDNKYIRFFKELQASGNLAEDGSELNSRILLVDGLNTFIRSFASSPVTNNDGEHVGGISGFLLSVGHAIKLIDPTRVVIVFDGKDGSKARRAIYPEYKAHRKVKIRLNRSVFVDKEDNQLAQLVRLIEYLEVLPVTVVILDGAEADDVIAYFAKQFRDALESQVYIMSSDKDFMQLVDQRTHIWSPTKKKMYFAPDVFEEYKIAAVNFALFRALTGDSSDNIPGVKGLGVKSLLERFPKMGDQQYISLDQFFEYATKLQADNPKVKIYSKVLEQEQAVRTYHQITQLSESMISGTNRLKIVETLNAPVNTLAKVKFHTMLIQDGMTSAIRNTELWLRETTAKLDKFALQS